MKGERKERKKECYSLFLCTEEWVTGVKGDGGDVDEKRRKRGESRDGHGTKVRKVRGQ